jgi:hypothetical protein
VIHLIESLNKRGFLGSRQNKKMRVRDGPEVDFVAEGGDMKEVPSTAATIEGISGVPETHIAKEIGCHPHLTSADLLYQFHVYIRRLERSHETCQFEQASILNELATEKEKNRLLNYKVTFLERRIAMLEIALRKRDPTKAAAEIL